MTREEYLAYWASLSPAGKRAEMRRGIPDVAAGLLLIVLPVVAFNYLPLMVAIFWAVWESLT